MADRPNLTYAKAKTKNKASTYNKNMDKILDYVDKSISDVEIIDWDDIDVNEDTQQ